MQYLCIFIAKQNQQPLKQGLTPYELAYAQQVCYKVFKLFC